MVGFVYPHPPPPPPPETCLLQCPSGLLHALLLYFARLYSVLLLAAVFFAAKNRAILCYGQIMVRNFFIAVAGSVGFSVLSPKF